jgi:tetratricopeptide (TPR) repeat protein
MPKKFALLSLILLSFCAPKPSPELAAPSADAIREIEEADALRQMGCYVALLRAFGIYERLYTQAATKKVVAPKLTPTALLLAAREKELGIVSPTHLDKALEVIRENPSLIAYVPYAEIVGLLRIRGKGVMEEIGSVVDPRFGAEAEAKLEKMDDELRQKASADEFFAYVYAARQCAFSSRNEKRDDLNGLWTLFPDSPLLKYKQATCSQENEFLLQALVAAEPQFYEAEYHLGNISLRQGLLLKSEEHFLKAYEGIRESPQITVSLASVAFATEELERSLDFYEKTLALAPEYREALLGKAVCLSYLSRPAEAISVGKRIIALGYWLLGESYYWMAWNQHELKEDEAAAASIEESKGRLPTSSEVFTLSGIIAMERGDPVKAEKDFKEALQYNSSNSEALFRLGSLYSQREDWPNSADYFERAGWNYGTEALVIQNKIDQAEKSTMAAERKEKFLKKKRYQLEKTRLIEATAFYNSAAGFFNAGRKAKALELATRAAAHPSFKQKAEELVSRIKF